MLTVDGKKTDWKNIPLQKCMEGNALDAYYTLKLFYIFEEKLRESNLLDLYKKMLVPAVEQFSIMEFRGLDVDLVSVDELDKELSSEIRRIEDMLAKLVPMKPEDTFTSTQSLQDILYTREGGLELYPPDKTSKKNEPSTAGPTIEILLTQINEALFDE